MKRLTCIINPVSGTAVDLEALSQMIEERLARQWQVEIKCTEGEGDATRLATAAAAGGVEVVCACGGDGTVNEVLQALANTETALAVIPFGTGNVWAKEIGVPMDTGQAIAALDNSRVATIDLGKVDDRYFLLMAGVGYDAEVTAKTDKEAKRRFGMLAYVSRALAVAAHYRGSPIRLTLDGMVREARVLMLVIGNTRLYGGQLELTSSAIADDGELDVCLFKGRSVLLAPWYLLRVLFRRHLSGPGVDYYRVKTLKVESCRRLPVQVDGDAVGHTPVTVVAVPLALKVLVPGPKLPAIFSRDVAQQI